MKKILANENSTNVKVDAAKLGNQPALKVRYTTNNYTNYIVETVLPLNNTPVIYSIHLITDADHEKRDIKLFEQIVSSFTKRI